MPGLVANPSDTRRGAGEATGATGLWSAALGRPTIGLFITSFLPPTAPLERARTAAPYLHLTAPKVHDSPVLSLRRSSDKGHCYRSEWVSCQRSVLPVQEAGVFAISLTPHRARAPSGRVENMQQRLLSSLLNRCCVPVVEKRCAARTVCMVRKCFPTISQRCFFLAKSFSL